MGSSALSLCDGVAKYDVGISYYCFLLIPYLWMPATFFFFMNFDFNFSLNHQIKIIFFVNTNGTEHTG